MLRNSRFIPVFVIPVHMLINLFPGEYLSAVKGQILADFILPGCQQNLLFSVPQISEDEPAFIMLVSLRADYYAAIGDDSNAKKWGDRLESINNDI